MKFSLLILVIGFWFTGLGQNPKGLDIRRSDETVTGTTRALVIGISAYQHITSLEYADRDAEEFANFLTGNATWRIPAENINLLKNENAKAGDILSFLSWLVDSSKRGDKVVFYFSGHGDVETVADSSQGFLLAYDSPQNNYNTGAISISILQKAFGRIIGKGAKLFLFTDACRAGHLAGGSRGAEQTAKAFSSQWRNETKVLSAQPDEVSFEGKEWGGGRGVFSFFLIKGLTGHADANKDSAITLSEIEQYVGLQVSEETKYKQQPIFEGPSKFSMKISRADTSEMIRYSQWKTGSDVVMIAIKEKRTKGQGDLDSSSGCPAYNSLLQYLSKGNIDSSAWLNILVTYDSIALCRYQEDRNKARYIISAALMNDVQQTVKQTLIGQRLVAMDELNGALMKIDWLGIINKQSELIYADHISNIRKYLLISKLSYMLPYDRMVYANQYNLSAMLDSAIMLEPTAAYLLNAKGILFFYTQKNKEDSAISYFEKAAIYSPTWLMPKLLIGHVYQRLEKKDSAIFWYEKILKTDPSFRKFECALCFYQELGDLYNESGKYNEAVLIFKEALILDPSNVRCMFGLVKGYIGTGRTKDINLWLTKIGTYDSTVADKLETLEFIIENKLWKKSDIEKRLKEIEPGILGDDNGWSRGLYRYNLGLFKDTYNLGSGINDFGYAIEVVQELKEETHIKFRMGFIKSRIINLKLVDAGGPLDEYIDFIKRRYSTLLTKQDLYNLDYYKSMYLLISGDDVDQGIQILQGLWDKKIIDCNTIRDINALLRSLEKYGKKYMYPESLKTLLLLCN